MTLATALQVSASVPNVRAARAAVVKKQEESWRQESEADAPGGWVPRVDAMVRLLKTGGQFGKASHLCCFRGKICQELYCGYSQEEEPLCALENHSRTLSSLHVGKPTCSATLTRSAAFDRQ